ncbi:NAD(P)/FAD-dependent oxidoreductase [Saccharopolyspora taberi]|uniref:FAD-dependent oxidoreductase n=1 Tax=Saccharopolyspora taberi TaxID=60895 RepID=A0ABN3VGB0_9PSEU
MNPVPDAVVVGAGQAGYQTAASLRSQGFSGGVVLIGDEPGTPYQRPPLSKTYLAAGDEDPEFRSAAYYAKNDITLINQRVVGIDREARAVRLADGESVAYGHLVLATGSRTRSLPVPGADLRGITTLRTRADADALRAGLAAAERVVVVGAGFIGFEIAAAASKFGHRVTVVEATDRAMARVVSARTAERFTAFQRENGNEVLFGSGVRAFHGTGGHVSAVELTDGTELPADLVVLGVGITPNTELAEEAGLEVADGVVVGDDLLTSDPDISAIGDCAAFPHARLGRRVRLESVQNATDHARCVADRLTGAPRPYRAVPWFWTEQFDARLQIAGVSDGHDTEVLLGDGESAFSVLLFRDRRLVGVESVNRPGDHMAARKLLAADSALEPAEAERPGFVLKDYVRNALAKV